MPKPRNKFVALTIRIALIPVGLVAGIAVIVLGVLVLVIGLVIAVPVVMVLVIRYWVRRLAGNTRPVVEGDVIELMPTDQE